MFGRKTATTTQTTKLPTRRDPVGPDMQPLDQELADKAKKVLGYTGLTNELKKNDDEYHKTRF
jgi:hypothetical protein